MNLFLDLFSDILLLRLLNLFSSDLELNSRYHDIILVSQFVQSEDRELLEISRGDAFLLIEFFRIWVEQSLYYKGSQSIGDHNMLLSA